MDLNVDNSTLDVVLVPGIVYLVGILIYAFSMERSVAAGFVVWYRWIGYGLVGIAFIQAFPFFYAVANPNSGFLYRTVPAGRYVTVAHWGLAPFMLLNLIIMFATERWVKRVIHRQSLE